MVEEEIAKENVYAVQSAWNTIPGDYEIYIEIDSNNEIIEMNETNNIAFKPFQVRTVPDLIVEPNDMFFSNPSPDEGEEITIFSMIHNSESVNTTNFYVQIYYDDPSNMIAEEIIYIEENGTQVILSPWTAMAGEHNIYIDVDPYEEVEELDETNNFASRIINVISTGSLPPVMSNLPEMYIDIDNPIFQFDLDEYVTDPDNTINQLTWSYYGNYNISIDIDINHIATISPISGEDILETITFRVEDPNGNFDEKSTFVNVSNFTDGDGDNFFMEVNDCDDTKLLVNPFMEENCRTVYDDNCDGRINEGCKKIVYPYFRMD